MTDQFRAPKGVAEYAGAEAARFAAVRDALSTPAHLAGYGAIELPIFEDTALFARYSDGAAYNADRITFFNSANLVNGASSVIPVNEVKQFEGGVKWRQGGVSVFATVFLGSGRLFVAGDRRPRR